MLSPKLFNLKKKKKSSEVDVRFLRMVPDDLHDNDAELITLMQFYFVELIAKYISWTCD
jgi:hypothetical protein